MRTYPDRTLVVAITVSLGGFLFGFDASVISGVIRFIRPEFNLTDLQLGWVVSSPSFSAMFAMLVAGTLADVVGRKRVLLTVAFLFVLSAVLSVIASGYVMLVVARMVGGAAFGAALVLAPVYIAEIAQASDRGKMVSVQQLNIVLGFSAAYFANYIILQNIGVGTLIDEGNAWRWMFAAELIPALLYFFAMFTVPKSPRWLIQNNREKEAIAVLTFLHGEDVAAKEAAAIRVRVGGGQQKRAIPVRFLFGKRMRFVLTVALIIGVLQQITGVNAIYFYATMIFEQSGIGANAAFAQAIWVGIINVAFTILAMVLIDRMGRRPLLLIGIAGIAISMMITAFGFSQATYKLTEPGARAIEGLEYSSVRDVVGVNFQDDVAFKNAFKNALASNDYAQLEGELIKHSITMNPMVVLVGILGFVASFAFSLGPVMWVMLSELFPTRLRGLAISVVGFVNSFVSWLVQFVFPWELSHFGSATTYLIYGVFAIVGFVLLARLLPETKGKSLEDLELELVRD